ncbi:Uncharacterized protein DBV15_10741 [Temnothorax longispinosus]|uniref:Uncharacterized protein n=1 Tax=Temnothorax longispinosus TaxID=300112 RepID=A0A4S2L1Q5_9HYME|nr:Uncharacterized protein DBV15_10741 [Temnothorax longispinosus]
MVVVEQDEEEEGVEEEDEEEEEEEEEVVGEKEDDGDVATRVVGEVKQTTDRSPLLLYGVHHGVDFQRCSSRRPQRREGLDGARGWEVGGGKRSDARFGKFPKARNSTGAADSENRPNGVATVAEFVESVPVRDHGEPGATGSVESITWGVHLFGRFVNDPKRRIGARNTGEFCGFHQGYQAERVIMSRFLWRCFLNDNKGDTIVS